MTNTTTTKTDAPRVVTTLDAGDHTLDVAILGALADSDDPDDRALGVAGKAAFDRARENGEPVKSALGMARLAMAEHRNGA